MKFTRSEQDMTLDNDLSQVKRDKNGFYIEINIRTRLPVVLDIGTKLNFVHDVDGYMTPTVGLSWLYKLLDSFWRKDSERPIIDIDQKLIDRFFAQWYQLETFKHLGLKDYPILIEATQEERDAIPYEEFEKSDNKNDKR